MSEREGEKQRNLVIYYIKYTTYTKRFVGIKLVQTAEETQKKIYCV